MSYCINPNCPKPNDPANANKPICRNCGSELLIKGRYQVMRLLSDNSGFGKIYEAYGGTRPKILKILKETHNRNLRVVELFQQEAAVLSQLNHPGIPKVKSDGYFQFFPRHATEPLHCIIMEKIEGLTLKQWMQQQGNHPISQQQALHWLKQLTEILHLVHQKNYFHRDIKPQNIMIRANGQLVLIDFGTAREMTFTYLAGLGGASQVTKISSAGYTPPEQEKGHAVPQSDFYALGRTMAYLLTGKQATDSGMYEPFTDEFKWRQYAPQISPMMADCIDKLMAHKASDRPKSTQEILDDVERIQRDDSLPQPSSHKVRPTFIQSPLISLAPPKLSIRSYQKLLVGSLALALSLGLGGYWIWQNYIPSPFSQFITYENTSLAKTLAGHSSHINDVTISPDGQLFASASADKTIKVWNLATGQEIYTLKGHASYVNVLAISPDGRTLVSGSADKTIKLWDLGNGKEIRTLGGHSNYVKSVAISPDGQMIASGSSDKTVKLWNLATGQEIRTLQGHLNDINSLAISANSQILASGSADKTIKIWNLSTGQEIRTLQGHSSYVNSLALSPNGEMIASGSADKTIKIWNLSTGQEIRTLQGHSNYVNSLAISPDEETIISASADKTIKIWHLSTGKEIRTLRGHSSWVNSLDLSPDGDTIASGSADKTIKIWRVR